MPHHHKVQLYSWPLLLQLLLLLALLATHVSSSETTWRAQRRGGKARHSSSSRQKFWLTPERRKQPDTITAIKAAATSSSTTATTTSRGTLSILKYKDVLATALPFECSRNHELLAAIQPRYQPRSRWQGLRGIATSGCRASKAWAGAAWFDLDGDNRLDYMNNHHFGKCFASSGSELAARARRPDAGAGCASNYEWVVGLSSLADEAGDAPLVWHERTLQWEDVVNDDESDFANAADCHGMVVADIDGDGLQDVYCQMVVPALSKAWEATVAEFGEEAAGPRPAGGTNSLLWGTTIRRLPFSPSHGTDPTFQLVGGRDTAIAAGLIAPPRNARHAIYFGHVHGRDEATGSAIGPGTEAGLSGSSLGYKKRGLLALDANLDGILDFYLCHRPTSSGGIYGSVLLVSEAPTQPGRKPRWHDPDTGMMNEWTVTAYLADLDNDGWAREVIMQRDMPPQCLLSAGQQLRSSKHTQKADKWQASHDAHPKAWREFCTETHPAFTLAMYKLDEQGTPSLLTSPYAVDLAGAMVRDYTSVDVDGDGLSDVVFVNANGLYTFPSRLRKTGEAPSQATMVTLDAFPHKLQVATVVALDTDLDGLEEILVVGATPGTNRLYRARVVDVGTGLLEYELGSAGAVGLSGAVADDAESAGALPLQVKAATVMDYNNDGFPDLHLALDGPDLLLENTLAGRLRRHGGMLPHYIALRLVGRRSNRDAVGATVVMHATGVVAGVKESVHVREVRRGGRDRGFEDPRVVFGLGVAGRVTSLSVLWPDGHTQRVADVDGIGAGVDNMASPYIVREQ